MGNSRRPITILVADDDPDDRFLIEEAFKENRISNPLDFVEDGEQLLAYLRRESEWERLAGEPYPGLILLDLNMPKMDGRAALKEMKTNEKFSSIPVVILTTSKADEDVDRTYCSGVNSFISKPVTFEGLVEIVRVIKDYWIEIVRLPPECTR